MHILGALLLKRCADENIDKLCIRRNDGLVEEGLLPAGHLLDAGLALDEQLSDGGVAVVAGQVQWCRGVFLWISLCGK